MELVPVALRCEEPELIETVRSVLAVNSIPVAVYPETAALPAHVGLVLDAGAEPHPSWKSVGRRYLRVGLWNKRSSLDPDVTLLPQGAETLLSLARAANRVFRAKVIGVVGASGGVGASVFAATLARIVAEAGLSSVLVEGGGGPSQHVLLNLQYEPGLRWADVPRTGVQGQHLAQSLPKWAGVRVLATDDRPAPALHTAESVLMGLAQSHDVVVMDLQRHDVTSGITKRWCDSILLLTTCDLPAASAAQAMSATLTTEDVHLLVRGPARGGFTPSVISKACSVPLIASMRAETSLPAGLERGATPGDHRRGPLVRTARTVVEKMGIAA